MKKMLIICGLAIFGLMSCTSTAVEVEVEEEVAIEETTEEIVTEEVAEALEVEVEDTL